MFKALLFFLMQFIALGGGFSAFYIFAAQNSRAVTERGAIRPFTISQYLWLLSVSLTCGIVGAAVLVWHEPAFLRVMVFFLAQCWVLGGCKKLQIRRYIRLSTIVVNVIRPKVSGGRSGTMHIVKGDQVIYNSLRLFVSAIMVGVVFCFGIGSVAILAVGIFGDIVKYLLPSTTATFHLEKVSALSPSLPIAIFAVGAIVIVSLLIKLRRDRQISHRSS